MPVRKSAKSKNSKKPTISIKNLAKDQREFIENKVKSLNSLKSVCEFYKLEDAVTTYALKIAKKLKLQPE